MPVFRGEGYTRAPEVIREPAQAERLPDLVDRIPRRTPDELEDDLRRLARIAAEAFDFGMYSLAERTLVRLAYTVSSHYGDTDPAGTFAALRFIERGERPTPLHPITRKAV